MQKKIINLHAGPALMMCSTLMGAAVLMGVLVKNVEGTESVITCMSGPISGFLPAVLGRHLPLDRYFKRASGPGLRYGQLFLRNASGNDRIGEGFGIAATPIAVAMVVCRNCATFISPHGSRHPSGRWPGRRGHQGPYREQLFMGMGLQLYLHDRCRPVRDHALIIENLRKKNAVSLRADHSPVGTAFLRCKSATSALSISPRSKYRFSIIMPEDAYRCRKQKTDTFTVSHFIIKNKKEIDKITNK